MPKVPPPHRGVANKIPPRATPAHFCRPSGLLNMRPDSKGRLAQRDGMRKLFSSQMGNGSPVQALEVVSRASTISGYQIGQCNDLDSWSSRASDILVGQTWLLERNRAMVRDYYLNVTAAGPFGDSGPAATHVTVMAVNRTGTRFAVAANYTDGSGLVVTRIAVLDESLNLVWSQKFTGAVDTRCFSLAFTETYLLACINENLYVLDNGNGTTITNKNMETWTNVGGALGKACSVAVHRVAATGVETAYVGFNGSPFATTLGSGIAVTGNHYSSMWRAGVMKYSVSQNPSVNLTQDTSYGAGLSGGTFWEANHGYARVSELTANPPYGCYINAIAVDEDGSVFIARTNQGSGPNGVAYPPNGSAPYVTLMKLSPGGTMEWELDTDSIRAANFGGYVNDFDVGALDYSAFVYTVDPSIQALAVDSFGDVYAVGKRTLAGATDGWNVFFIGGDGLELWRVNMSGTLRGAAIDPLDGQVIVTGNRNADWNGTTGAGDLQHLWKLNANDGSVVWKYDLAEANIDGQAVVVAADGRIAYCTEKVT